MHPEPYKRLFVVALLLGGLGVLLWPIYLASFISYPILAHQHFMVLGMFLAFVTGFLMTALPKMSGAHLATELEVNLAATLIILGSLFSLMGYEKIALILCLVQFIHLFIFMGARFLVRRQNPPIGIMFVPLGLLWGFVGVFLTELTLFNFDIGKYFGDLRGVALYQAFLLNLIIGLGSRLIPFLTRIEQVNPMQTAVHDQFKKAIFHAVVLNLGFLLEPIIAIEWTYFIRALVLASAAINMFRLLSRSEFTVLGSGIRLSVLAMILGIGGIAFFPASRLALLHIVFIAGFALLTFMIATRVVLAHGGHPLLIEKRSWQLGSLIGLLTLAATFRSVYFLNLAASFWMLALAVWFYGVGKFIFKNQIDQNV